MSAWTEQVPAGGDFLEAGDEEERWAGQYSSSHSILLVGEGDFSFSLALAVAFRSGANIVATSLDSRDILIKKYGKAESNLEKLKKMKATILHGVDATTMRLHPDLKMRRFDRIVFNFPHAGFIGKEDNPHVIRSHRNLVMGYFSNARHLLRPYGEVHVSHKTGGPFQCWNIEDLASSSALVIVERVDFSVGNYPGYNHKRGDGPNCDQPFPLGKASTFKFRIGNISRNKAHNAAHGLFRSQPNHVGNSYISETTAQDYYFSNSHHIPRSIGFPGNFAPAQDYYFSNSHRIPRSVGLRGENFAPAQDYYFSNSHRIPRSVGFLGDSFTPGQHHLANCCRNSMITTGNRSANYAGLEVFWYHAIYRKKRWEEINGRHQTVPWRSDYL